MDDDTLRAQLRHAEEQRVHEALLRLVYESISEVIYLLAVEPGEQYRFVSVNRAFLQATGLTVDQVIGRSIEEVLPPSSHALVRDRYAAAIRDGRLVAWEETAAYPAGEKVGEVTVQPILDEDGRCTHLLGTVHDITELRRMQSELDQVRRLEAIGQLAGGIAHDFNNLLSVILSLSDMAAADLGPEHPLTTNLLEIHRAGRRAADMTKQLLGFSRRQVRRPRVMSLNEAIEELDDMMRRLVREDVVLETRLQPGLGNIEMDPGQVEQIIVNLAVNARDAMPSGGVLTVTTASTRLDEEHARNEIGVEPGDYVVLSVSDTGVGMDDETQERIFEPFFTTKGAQGTGLGLSTVFGIVKQNAGHIRVRSQPNRGTTFEVYLPRARRGATADQAEKPVGDGLWGDETILLVEDDAEVRSIALEILERQGYRVLTASNGAQALSRCEEHEGQVDLLLTDVIMPGMSGRELARHIRSRWPDTRILYMSGYTGDAGDLQEGSGAVADLVDKPITPGKLLSRVREVLDGSAAAS